VKQFLRQLPLAAGLVLAGGCGSNAPDGAAATEPSSGPVAVVAPTLPISVPTTPSTSTATKSTPTTPPTVPVRQPVPPTTPTAERVDAIRIPNDLAGKVFTKAMAPAPFAVTKLLVSSAARIRVSPLDGGELPETSLKVAPVSIPLPVGKPARPTPPPEQAPTDLGRAAAENLSLIQTQVKPLVKSSRVLNPGAADVPPLSRQLPDRASLEDPTADIARVRIVETAFLIPVLEATALRLVIPDPFEFVEQLKGKLPARDFGNSPMTVPPGRP